MTPIALTIAGSDPSGGAGLQADLKTFHQHRVYGMSVVTLLTVQNTQTVSGIEFVSHVFLLSQLDAVLSDLPPAAAKTGALGNTSIIEAVAQRAAAFLFPLVVDPVMVSKQGDSLMDDEAADVLAEQLLPQAFLVTPNRFEASKLSEMEVGDVPSMEKAAKRIALRGAKHVLIKGGRQGDESVDVLWSNQQIHRLTSLHLETNNVHGTGCVLSAAITARLASGESVLAAVTAAKRFVTEAIRTSPRLGKGFGPINLHADVS